VVGLGHVAGIKKYWTQPVRHCNIFLRNYLTLQIDIDSLLLKPPPSVWTLRRLILAFMSTFVGIFAILIYNIFW